MGGACSYQCTCSRILVFERCGQDRSTLSSSEMLLKRKCCTVFRVFVSFGIAVIFLGCLLGVGNIRPLTLDPILKMAGGARATAMGDDVLRGHFPTRPSQSAFATSTLSDILLNSGQFQMERVQTSASDLEKSQHYLFQSTADLDRPGNALFQLASGMCLAQMNNLTHALSLRQQFSTFFRNAHLFVSSSTEGHRARLRASILHTERFCCSYDEQLVKLAPGRDHTVRGYLQSWKYFEPCKQEIKAAIAFTDDVTRNASNVIKKLRVEFPGMVLVGIHVRMEDFTNSRAANNGKKIAPPAYFLQAMRFFRSRLGRVAFVVITEDPLWWLRNVKDTINVRLLPRSAVPVLDLEILSLLDHVIVSVGTFGWWAGYRNNGTVVVYKDFYEPDTRMGNQIFRGGDDFLYPTWLRM